MGEPNLIEITASTIIRFAENLEDDSSKFYRNIANRFMKNQEIFLTFAKENEKNKTLLTRTYQETVSDALETGFSFKSLNLKDYQVETALSEDSSYKDALKAALETEEKARKFYLDVAERSRLLLATIPRAFEKVATERDKRKSKLKMLLDDLVIGRHKNGR